MDGLASGDGRLDPLVVGHGVEAASAGPKG